MLDPGRVQLVTDCQTRLPCPNHDYVHQETQLNLIAQAFSSPARNSASRNRGVAELKGVPGVWQLFAVA